MENRRGIRNWDAFGTLYNFASRMLATELLEPVLKFTFDLSAALLLGVTFIFQSLSVLIALDVVVLSFYQVTCTYLCGILSALMMFIASERERTATVRSLVKYFTNIMWVKIIYTVHPDCWRYMSGGPIMAGALVHTLVGFYTERLNSEQSLMTQTLYSLFLLTLFLIVFNTIYLAPEHILLETVFMLRCPIDTLCSAFDTIFKLCDTALGVDNRIPVYTTQIARYSFWSAVHLFQFLLINTTPTPTATTTSTIGRRADKYIYFFLFLHDLLELAVPVRLVLVQLSNERYITKTFPKLTAQELSAVCDETCPVCLSEHTRDTVRLRCNHLLHAGCLHSILRQNTDTQQHSRCPMCRADIDITPPSTRGSGIFGAGMRGLRARTTRPMYRTVNNTTTTTAGSNNTIQATASGRFGTAEQLIADHLQQHNLQQGDVIHIRIIPRGSRASVSTGTGTNSAHASSTDINTNSGGANVAASASSATGAGTSTITGTSTVSTATTIRPQPLAPSPRPVRMFANAATSARTNTTTSTTNTTSAIDTVHPSPSQVMETALAQAEQTSVLRAIHAHGLYTDSEHSSTGSIGMSIDNGTGVSNCTTFSAAAHTNTTYTTDSTAMDVDTNHTTASMGDFLSNEEIEQLLRAADTAINRSGSTSAANATSAGNTSSTATTGVTFDTSANVYNDAVVQDAIDNYTPLPLAHDLTQPNTTSTTSTTNTTHEAVYEQTQVDSQSYGGGSSSGSGSGSGSGSDRASVDDDEDASVADTAHSSDDDTESVDLFHHIVANSNTIPRAVTDNTTDAATTHTATSSTNTTPIRKSITTNTTTTSTSTTTNTTSTKTSSPDTSLKLKHSVVDLVSSPESPSGTNNNSSTGTSGRGVMTPERVVYAASAASGGTSGSMRGSGKRDSAGGVKEEPAPKIQRVDSE